MREELHGDYDEEAGLSFRDVMKMLRRQARVILAFVAAGLLIGTVIAAKQRRTYSAAAVIRIDERRAGLPTFDPRASAGYTGNNATAEMEVLRSRMLAAAVADSLRLQVWVTEPRGLSRDDVFAFIDADPLAPRASYEFYRVADARFAVRRPEVTPSLAGRLRSLVGGRGSEDTGMIGPLDLLPAGTFAVGDTISLPGARLVLGEFADSLPSFIVNVASEDAAVNNLVNRLRVRQPQRDGGVLRVETTGGDPRLVRDIPNVAAAKFIEMRRGNRFAESRGTIDYLRHQLDSIGTQLNATEYELQTFREANRVVDLPTERSTQVRRMADLQAERASLDVERTALSQIVEEIRASGIARSEFEPTYRRLVAFPGLLRSSATSDIVRSISRFEDQKAELLVRRQPNDPDVRALTSRIEQLEAELQTAVMTYLGGLANQMRSIDTQLAQSNREASRIPDKEARFARLSRQSKLLEDIYSTVKTRLTEAEVLHAVDDQSVSIVDVASPTLQPLSIKRAFILGGWTALGLILGLGVAFFREYRDGSVRSPVDLQMAAGVPVLGMIPKMTTLDDSQRKLSGGNGALLPRTARSSGEQPRTSVVPVRETRKTVPMLSGRTRISMIAAEAYRRLHLNMLRSRPGVSTRVFLITSPLPGDGKTTTSVNLALTLAQRGYRVALVDADLRQGPLRAIFGVEATAPSLADLLASPGPQDSWAEFTRPVFRSMNGSRDTGIDLIAAGKARTDPAVLLDSPRFPELVEWLRGVYDVVIVDSPPAAIVTDASALGTYVDGVVLVARAGVTPFDALQFVATQFRAAQVTVLGTVMNDVEMQGASSDDPGFRWYEYGKDYFSPTATTAG
jgi:polysaccharide biosynthesis transport protein